MEVTVVLCTYNRCESLRIALESIAASKAPEPFGWEAIVVDNNSTDGTPAVVAELSEQFPNRFRYIFEAAQGLSSARNRGIREARGEIIVFTDDDVTVEPDWLWNLTEKLRNGEFKVAGGRVLPAWSCPQPSWLPVELSRGVIVSFDYGAEPRELVEPPFGANMAFRKEIFEKYGYFRTDLGRCGDSLLSNEDTDFGRRLIKGGERIRYEPGAVVHHPVAENRLKKEYFLKWWYDKGRADVREQGKPPKDKWPILGVPFRHYVAIGSSTVKWLTDPRPMRRFYHKVCVWHYAGAIKEWLELGRTTSTKQGTVVSGSKPSA